MTDERPSHLENIERILAEETRAFFRPTSLDDTLTAVTASVVKLIDAADCADILVVAGHTSFQSHAATSALPVRLDALQEEYLEGPCVDAARRDVVVTVDDFKADPRWPRFGPAAVAAGVRSSICFQLYLSGDSLGALNIFSAAPGAFDQGDVDLGTIFATHAAIALYAANKNAQFESALASRDGIGQAKGMLMERYRIDAVQAFALLSKLSQDSNVPLSTLARDVIARGSEHNPH